MKFKNIILFLFLILSLSFSSQLMAENTNTDNNKVIKTLSTKTSTVSPANETSSNSNTSAPNKTDVILSETNSKSSNNTTNTNTAVIDNTVTNTDVNSDKNIVNDWTWINSEQLNTTTTWPLDYINNRTKYLENKIWLHQKTDTQTESTNVDKKILNNKLEKSVLEEMKILLENKTNKISQDIHNNETKLSDLNKQLLSEKEKWILDKNKITDLNKTITNLENTIEVKKALIKKYEDNKIITDDKIKKSNNNVEELNIYKSKLETKLLEEQSSDRYNLIISIIIYWLVTLLYIIIFQISNNRKEFYKKSNNQDKLNNLYRMDILIGILFVLFTIIFLIIKNPWIWLILIILWSALIWSIKSKISSFIASFNVITKYKVWQLIAIWTNVWEIKSMNLTSTTLNLFDKDSLEPLNKDINIPNSFFDEKEVIRLKPSEWTYDTFNFKVNFKELSLSFNDFIKEIDNIFFKENILMIDSKRKKRYYLKLKWTWNNEYEFFISFKENRIDTSNIDIKIIELIQKNIKKETEVK